MTDDELERSAKLQTVICRFLDMVVDLQGEPSETLSAKKRMKLMAIRLTAACWLIKPELIRNQTTEQLAAQLGCDGSLLRHHIRKFSELFGIRSPAQHSKYERKCK